MSKVPVQIGNVKILSRGKCGIMTTYPVPPSPSGPTQTLAADSTLVVNEVLKPSVHGHVTVLSCTESMSASPWTNATDML